MNEFSRTISLIGIDAFEKLKGSSVAVFGIGGVGSYVSEALARSGVGSITLVDGDNVDISNINRQLIALHSTIGLPKVEVAKRRIMDINPNAQVNAVKLFYCTPSAFSLNGYDYIVDAIDTVTSKLLLIEEAYKKNIPIISSMGAGNKLDPSKFEVTDIYKTSVCPLARVMRRELKKHGIEHLKVVYSKEPPISPHQNDSPELKKSPASIAFVPSVAGLILAGEVIRDLAEV